MGRVTFGSVNIRNGDFLFQSVDRDSVLAPGNQKKPQRDFWFLMRLGLVILTRNLTQVGSVALCIFTLSG